MATKVNKFPTIDILESTCLDTEHKRFSIRYVLETKFERAKKELEKENISLYVLEKTGGNFYIGKPLYVYENWEEVMFMTLHKLTFSCKTVKMPYSEAYHKVYNSSNEVKFYRSENKDGVFIVGNDKEVDKICHEIEKNTEKTAAAISSKDSKDDISGSWEDLAMTDISLSQEEQALIHLHRMLNMKVFKDDSIIVKEGPYYTVSIQLHPANSSEKMKREIEIKEAIKTKSSELHSYTVDFNSQEFTFLCRQSVYEYVDEKVNSNRAYRRYAWYIDKVNKSVKVYTKDAYHLKAFCERLKDAFITGSMPVPVKYFTSPKGKQKMSELISRYSEKLNIRLDSSATTLHFIYTDDKKHDFHRDVTKFLLAIKTVNIVESWKLEFCKHIFRWIQVSTEDRYTIELTEEETKTGKYGWIIKGEPEDVKAAFDELYEFVKKICRKERIYQTDEDFKKIQENMEKLVIETKCCGSPEVIKSHVVKSIDMRREVLCREWQLLNSNIIKILNTGDHCWIPKQAVKWSIVLSDDKKLWFCKYQKTQSTVTLCLPAWKDNVAQEKHTLSTMLDKFYKSSALERPTVDVPFVLFLSEPMQHKWPWETFLKELLSALRRNSVLYPLHIFERDRKTLEMASEIIQKFASQASRPPSIKVTVKSGELSKEKCDAIVNSANEKLSLNTGAVSTSILKAAGKEIQDQCSEIMKKRGDLTSKDVVVSNGYNLPCRFVFHGALQSWENQTLSEFAYNCLWEADARKLSSIAFPSLGTGKLQYPVDIVAGIMFQTVQIYDTERKKHFLKDVNFVIFGKDHNALTAFQKVEQKLRAGCSKTEIRDKCPNPYFFKLTLTGENESKIEETFLKIQDNIKVNSEYPDKVVKEPISPTISRSDEPTFEAGGITEERDNYDEFMEWEASDGRSPIGNPEIDSEAKENDNSPCFVKVTIFGEDSKDIYTNLVKMLAKYGVEEENVIWCHLKPNEARIQIRNKLDVDNLIRKMKKENRYEFIKCSTDAVVNIRAKLNTSISLYLATNRQTAIDLKKQSGVDVLHENDGTIILTGDLCSISFARDLLLKWKSEVSDVKRKAEKPDKEDQGKGDMPGTDNQTNSGISYPGNQDRAHDPNNDRDSQFDKMHGDSVNQITKDTSDRKRNITSRSEEKIEILQNHKSVYKSNDKSLNVQSQISSIENNPEKLSVPDMLPSNAQHADFQIHVTTGGKLNEKGENIVNRAMQLNVTPPSVRPKEYTTDKYTTPENQLPIQTGINERQEQTIKVGSKGKAVPTPRHTIYTQETLNMIDEENQTDEPASHPTADMTDIKMFPEVNGDSLMMTTKEGINVYIYQGNLCYLKVKGIVNSSNESMNHRSGLFSVIAEEAGKKILYECKEYLARYTKLQQGQICVTSAGNLEHYTNVLHACAPVWADRETTESYIEGLMDVIINALIAADDNRLKNIAIPAIGSGGRGGPRQVCFSSFPRAITKYSSKFGKSTSIKEVHFVDRDTDVVSLMQAAFLLAIDESHDEKSSKLMRIPKKIKETFLSYVGTDIIPSKSLALALPNTVDVLLCDGALFSVPRHKHGQTLKVEEDDTGVIITIDKLTSGKSRSASLCLQRCGNDFHRNYDGLKRKKKSYGEAYDTFGDKHLKFGHVICPVMPVLSKKALDITSSAQLNFRSYFHQCCANMFRKADDCDVKHLAVPVLVDDFYDYNEDWFLWSCTNIMMMELHTFANNRKKTSGITIHFATNKNENLYQICKTSLSNPKRSDGTGRDKPLGNVLYQSTETFV